MLRRLICLGALALALVLPSQASAGFYVGAEGVYDGFKYESGAVSAAPTGLYGANFVVGYRISDGLSAELNYLSEYAANSHGDASVRGVGLSAELRVPLFARVHLDGIGGINYQQDHAGSALLQLSSYDWGWHLAVGPEIDLNPTGTVSWRTTVGYEQKGLTKLTLGGVSVKSGVFFAI